MPLSTRAKNITQASAKAAALSAMAEAVEQARS